MADINEPQEARPIEPKPTNESTFPGLTTPTPELSEPADVQTDAAVDDILKHDGDEVLRKQDEAVVKAANAKENVWQRFKRFSTDWWGNPKKRWLTIGGIVLVLAALFAIPYTRYNILGLVLKAPATVVVVDSKTGDPVSGATVELAGQKTQTDAEGKAVLRVNTGSKTLAVSKSYYKGASEGVLVTLSSAQNSYKTKVEALGRQVKIKVVNKISAQPAAGATVKVGTASTKTDKNGQATLVTPSSADTQEATVSLSGYNDAKVKVTANGDAAKNTFAIVPAGKLYFLSNLSGNLDVVKTNLDGTDRQTVLAGTGNEDRQSTSLLASRDWKYLALLSRRSGDKASVYLIDTTQNDKLTTVDQGNANFSFIGWSGSRFIYQVDRNTVQNWQPNKQALKSLDATTGQVLLLDQTQASGTNDNDYQRQSILTPYVINNEVVYLKTWIKANYGGAVGDKQSELDTINNDGSGHKTVKTFTPSTSSTYATLQSVLYEPEEIYVYFNDGGIAKFYEYEKGKVTEDSTMTEDKFYNTPYPTYLLSPSGKSTFWAEQRDGKNTLFTGDADAKNRKQVANLSPYNTYGWFTDDYLLVSKSSSELYIMSAAGGTPQKITDYYKPAITYSGYGGGYGGL